MLTINGSEIRTYYVTGLDKNTEYEFQLLAFTLAGDGPKSSVKIMRTMDNGKDSRIYSVSCILFAYFFVAKKCWLSDFNLKTNKMWCFKYINS